MVSRLRRCSRQVVLCFVLGFCIGIVIERAWNLHKVGWIAQYPKITCLLIVRNHHCRHLNAARRTWLEKCDKKLIISPEQSRKVSSVKKEKCNDTVQILATSGWDYLCHSFHLLSQPVEWLIIAPDSLHILTENLKMYVHDKDWTTPHYLGHAVGHYSGDYNVLSAGIVLSNASVNALLTAFPSEKSCAGKGNIWNDEDKFLGSVLNNLGINVSDTRDELGRGRFHAFNANTLLSQGKIFRQSAYFKKAVYPIKKGAECCSKYLVSLDSSDADHYYLEHFLVYNIGRQRTKTHSENPHTEDPPPWVQALRDIGYTGSVANMTSEEYYKIWEQHMSPQEFNKRIRDSVT